MNPAKKSKDQHVSVTTCLSGSCLPNDLVTVEQLPENVGNKAKSGNTHHTNASYHLSSKLEIQGTELALTLKGYLRQMDIF